MRLLDHIGGVPHGDVVLGRLRADLLGRELARQGAQFLLLVRQGERDAADGLLHRCHAELLAVLIDQSVKDCSRGSPDSAIHRGWESSSRRSTTKLADWIGRQRLFFVATAPIEGGHVNVSPKGPIGTLRIVDGRTVEYDDHVGSGAETAAHLRENGRVCVMLCAFDGPPRIVRLHGRGEVLAADDPADGVRASCASTSSGSPTRAATACR